MRSPAQAKPASTTRRRGFSLVEAIAAMVVVSTLGSVSSMVIARAVSAYKAAATLGQLQSELAAGFDRAEREVRGIRHQPAGVGADITAAGASAIAWNSAGGACSLSLAGGRMLVAADGGAGVAVLNDVSSLTVQCYDEAGAALPATLAGAACEAVRRVSITATVTRYGTTATLRTSIYLRSTMTGAE
jgi:hypothetical protein